MDLQRFRLHHYYSANGGWVSREAATPADALTLWASTFLVMGLRYTHDQINKYLQGVQQLKESSTYQAVLAEGRKEGIRATILRLGGKAG